MNSSDRRERCPDCKERCRCSLGAIKADKCPLAQNIAATGHKEQLSIRAELAMINKRSKKTASEEVKE